MSNVEENEGKSKNEYQQVKGSKEEEQAKTETKPTGAVPLELTLSQAQQPIQYHADSTPLVVSLRNVESHLKTDTDNREVWLSELSSKVKEFVETEHRALPTFACDTGGTSPLGKTFNSVKGLLENRIILLDERTDLLKKKNEPIVAKISSLSAERDSLGEEIDLLEKAGDQHNLNSKNKQFRKLAQQIGQIDQLKNQVYVEIEIIVRHNKSIAKQKEKIDEQQIKISQHHSDLESGTFFSSLDDVWTAEEEIFNSPTVDGIVFKRESQGDSNAIEKIFDYYEKTAIGALNRNNEVTDNSARSSDTDSVTNVDIFGGENYGSQSAHLMPHSSLCSSLWYTVVEWVLSLSPGNEQVQFAESSWWKVLQKCIHGYGKSNEGTAKQGKTVNSTESMSDKDGQDKNSASTKVRKTAKVGIKHFATNRIRLRDQALYLDDNPCLFIIPVMDTEQVKKWKGDGYYAIVLAGPIFESSASTENSTIDSKERVVEEGKVVATPASVIYENIRAWGGGHEGEFLATQEDLEKSRFLLATAVLCIVKSSMASYGPIDDDCLSEVKERHEDVKNKLGVAIEKVDKLKGKTREGTAKTFETLAKLDSVKVPANKNHSDHLVSIYVKVRKILFSSRVAGQSANLHLAPDPMLLLAKAASNWLKRQDLLLLPGCEVVSDDSSSVGYDEECEARGWDNRHPDKKQRITEITIQCRSSSTDDESVSDLDC